MAKTIRDLFPNGITITSICNCTATTPEDEEMTIFKALNILSTAYYGRQYYFQDDDETIYTKNGEKFYDIRCAVEDFESELRRISQKE